jgi:hypothetical protein
MLVSLKDFIAGGGFGPIPFGCNRLQLEAVVGEPEATGGTSRKYRQPVCWKYGDVEFYFSRTSGGLNMIHIDRFSGPDGSPQGWGGLQVDPWIIRGWMAQDVFVSALEADGIAHVVRPEPTWIQEIVEVSGVEIGFVCGADQFTDFVGLAYLTRRVSGD